MSETFPDDRPDSNGPSFPQVMGLDPAAFRQLDEARFRLAASYEGYGYQPVEVPLVAPVSVFERKSGSRVIPEIYSFRDAARRRLCLRPEFTALVVQLFNQRRADIGEPARLHYAGSVFRQQEDGAGSVAQFHESGVELLGAGGPTAEAEIVGLAIAALRAAGARDLRVTLGHIDIVTGFLRDLDLPDRVHEFLLESLAGNDGLMTPAEMRAGAQALVGDAADSEASEAAQAIAQVAKLTPDLGAEQLRAVGRAILASLDIRVTGRRQLDEVVDRIIERLSGPAVRTNIDRAVEFISRLREAGGPAAEALESAGAVLEAHDRELEPVRSLARVVELLATQAVDDIDLRVDLALGRGLQFYTGLVFEITGSDGTHLAGGGRYDDLVRLLGGTENTPAVGFTIRLEALSQAARPVPAWPPRVVVELGEQVDDALRVALALRQSGMACETVTPDTQREDALRVRLRRDAEGRLQATLIDGDREHTVAATDLLPALCQHFGGGSMAL